MQRRILAPVSSRVDSGKDRRVTARNRQGGVEARGASRVPGLPQPQTVARRQPSEGASGARRSIALDDDTVEVIRAHRKTQLEDRLKAGSLRQDLDLLFTQENRSLVRPPWFTRWVQHQGAEAGVPQIGVHGIRHTWATLALRLGIHPKVVAERLGHSSIKITLDTYSHAVPEMQERAAQRVADLVFGRSRVEGHHSRQKPQAHYLGFLVSEGGGQPQVHATHGRRG